jgi:hypothetical protein
MRHKDIFDIGQLETVSSGIHSAGIERSVHRLLVHYRNLSWSLTASTLVTLVT